MDKKYDFGETGGFREGRKLYASLTITTMKIDEYREQNINI